MAVATNPAEVSMPFVTSQQADYQKLSGVFCFFFSTDFVQSGPMQEN